MRKLAHANLYETFNVDAKSLKKGDSIWVGKRLYRVASNKKNDCGQRVLRLKWGSNKKKDEVLVIVPSKLVFSVRKFTKIHPQ